ncbi:MAG: DUF4115 domain-containing protein [Candidatus Omnitrophota bacterium]
MLSAPLKCGTKAPAATAPAHNAAAKTKVTEAAARKSVEWLRSVTAGNYPAIDKRASLDLRIKALDSVWLRITSDSKVLYQGILKKGQAEGWSAKETIEVWTGNASNIYLTLNRQTLGSPGRGVIKRMIITHQGIRISPSEARGQ